MPITLQITPTFFSASNGKLVSTTRYLKRSSSPSFYFISGKNMDVGAGGLRYINSSGTAVDDNTYSGTFAASPGVGVKL